MKKLFVLAVLLLTSACGIKPTPVLAAGPAPTLRNPVNDGTATDLILYFLQDDRAVPVARPAVFPTRFEATLTMLLDGPTAAETSDGYTTALPRSGAITLTPGPPTTVNVSFPLRTISAAGINQLVCTAFAALAAQSPSSVEGTIALAGPDVQLPYQTCQA
ncbi:hypothetical protein [Amycolatopsis sp. cmx-4-61]|uniref:hypothetical protein n=1 Tax=Amycolatopsis sp. cmx-4-61 TaxID=2790937 RepID=UPI003978D47D